MTLKIINEDEIEQKRLRDQAESRKKMTEEEQRAANRARTTKRGVTTLIYRNVRSNPDLICLLFIVLTCAALGFFVAKLVYGVSAKDVIGYIWEFANIVISAALATIFVIGKIFTRPGPIVARCQKQGNKPNIDENGWTIEI